MEDLVYIYEKQLLFNKNYINPYRKWLINKYLWNFNKIFFIFEAILLFLMNTVTFYTFLSFLFVVKIVIGYGFFFFYKTRYFNGVVNIISGLCGDIRINFFEKSANLNQDLLKMLYYLSFIFLCLFLPEKNFIWLMKLLSFLVYLGFTNYWNIQWIIKNHYIVHQGSH